MELGVMEQVSHLQQVVVKVIYMVVVDMKQLERVFQILVYHVRRELPVPRAVLARMTVRRKVLVLR